MLSEMTTHINNYRHYKKIPGLGAGIIAGGDTILQKGFGTCRVDDPYSRVNPDTIFSIESITKTFTAQALVHLEAQTDFDLDQPVIRYLPYFRTKSGAYHNITTRQLLNHTAGLPDNIWIATLLDEDLAAFIKDMPEYRFVQDMLFLDMEKLNAKFQTREDVTRYFAQIDMWTEPGKTYLYCPDAYVIAADVLEKASGLSWETYVLTHILKPLGMVRTFLNPDFGPGDVNATSYYLKTIDTPIETPRPRNSVALPIGYMYSTVTDLLTYLQSHMEADEGIMPRAAYEQMQRSFALQQADSNFGLGWQIKLKDGAKMISHAGSYPGVSTFAAIIPQYHFGIVLLANTDSIRLEKLADKILRIWLRKNEPG